MPTRRKIERLERDNTLLNELVNRIRDANDVEVRQITSLIRSNAPIDEVNATIQRLKEHAAFVQRPVNPMIEDIYLTTGRALSQRADSGIDARRSVLRSLVSPEPASRVLSVTRLIDEPLYQVPAAPWTTVSRDGQLVSHLISLWATWYHIFLDGIVLEPFLAAMKAAEPDSLLCSPFLVNCVLAAGCLFSDYDEAKTVRGKASSLMIAFVKEAEWYLAQDPSTPSITNVQGLCVLYVVVSQLHRDRDGYHYATRAATMSAELNRARESILADINNGHERTKTEFVLDTACWGVYSATSGSMLAWMRPQTITRPRTPRHEANRIPGNLHATKWSPYPHNGENVDMHLDESLRHHYTLSVLAAELSRSVYAEDQAPKHSSRKEALQDLRVRLFFWYAKLPDYMKQASPQSLSVTMLLIWYHGVVLTLLTAKFTAWTQNKEYGPEKDHDDNSISDGDEDGDCADDNEQGEEIIEVMHAGRAVDPLTDEDHPVHHARQIAGLFRAVRDTYGYSRFHCFMCQPSRVALYTLMECNDDHQYDADITELLTGMRAMSRRFPFTFTLLRMTQLDLRLRNLDLPVSSEKLFEEFDHLKGAAWREQGTFNSVYPSPQLFAGPYNDDMGDSQGARDPSNMIEFLRLFDGVRLS